MPTANRIWNVERPLLNQIAKSKGYKREPFKNKRPPVNNIIGLLHVMHHVELKKPKSGHRRAYAQKTARLASTPWHKIVHIGAQRANEKAERAERRAATLAKHYPQGIGASTARSWAASSAAPRRSTRVRRARQPG